ncbi:MAG: hypothetical protein ABSG69_10055 [Candidatus Acidiferrum sp.]
MHTDWYGWLPDAKLHAFQMYSNESETYYTMLSVSLDEAISLRDSGSLTKSFQVVDVTPALCSRLAARLQGLLSSLDVHARHFGIVPSVAPLAVDNFRGARGQHSARLSALLSRILLSQRAQFLSKIAALREMLTELSADFADAAEDLASGAATDSQLLWVTLDDDHFDLNTCLRETMVLLKCFLRVLPDDQLLSFQETVEAQMAPSKVLPQRKSLRHRRIPQFAAE